MLMFEIKLNEPDLNIKYSASLRKMMNCYYQKNHK
jgi:hypothetical protein